MDTFLDRLAQTGNVMLSAKAAGVPRRTVYDWRKKWITFATEWDDALDEAVDMLEGMAWKRAAKQSDRLLMFLLKAHRRGFYGDKQEIEHSGEMEFSINDWKAQRRERLREAAKSGEPTD